MGGGHWPVTSPAAPPCSARRLLCVGSLWSPSQASSSQFIQLLRRLIHSQDPRPHVCACTFLIRPSRSDFSAELPTHRPCLPLRNLSPSMRLRLSSPLSPQSQLFSSSVAPPPTHLLKPETQPCAHVLFYSPPRPRNSHSRLRSHLRSPLQVHELCPNAGHQVISPG